MRNAYVAKLGTDASGRRVDGVHVERNGRQEIYSSATVVVACGSLSSALLLLRSANDNLVALVDQNGRVETESVDASGDRPHLDPATLARIARISPEGADRNQRQFSDAFGAFGLPFVSPNPRVASIAQTHGNVAVRFVRRGGVSA